MDQSNIKQHWCEPVDILAMIIILGGLALLFTGHCNQTCDILLLAIGAFYFGLKSNLSNDKA